MRRPHNLHQGWDEAVRAATEQTAQRRARVLAHPDIAKRLTEPPQRYPSADLWNGYIPPATIDGGKHNTSPIRAQLVDILHAVIEREEQLAEEPTTEEDA